MSSIEQAADIIRESDSVVALTGARISKASGMPTFRDKGGLWHDIDARQWAERRAFDDDPSLWYERFWKLYNLRESLEPTLGHYALKDMVDASIISKVVTQNIDGLDLMAGTPASKVVEVHGSDRVLHCGDRWQSCGFSMSTEEWLANNNPDESIPLCPSCPPYILWGGDGSPQRTPLKPGILLFGDYPVPGLVDACEEANQAIDAADTLLVIGTSLEISWWWAVARNFTDRDKKPAIVINPRITPIDELTEVTVVRRKAEVALPQLRDLVVD